MEPSKKYSDNRVDTSGSEKSPVAIGHHINQNIYPEPKPIRVRPNPGEESLIWIGRKIMLALFGTLVHDMKGYALGTSGLTGLGLLIGYYSVYRNPFPSGSQPALYTELAGLIVVILAVYLGPLLFLTSRET